MIKTFTIATANIDDEGERFMPGSVKMPDRKVRIFRDFKYHEKPIGEVISIKEVDGNFIFEAELTDNFDNLFPCLGGDIIKYFQNGGVKEISEMIILCVGLCGSPNDDPKIKTIGEQCN